LEKIRPQGEGVNKKMKIWKPLTAVLVLLAIFTTIAATQYATIQVSYSYSINTRYSNIQLMAGDGSAVSDGYVLTNTSGVYSVNLGKWAINAKKTYSAAFAIVNMEKNVELRVTKIEFASGSTGTNYISINLHKNMAKSGTTIAPAADQEVAADTKAYVTAGVSADHSADGWVLAKAPDNYDTGTPAMPYLYNTGQQASATWDSTNNVWKRDTSHSDATGLTNAPGSAASFVWVEIVIDATGATEADYSGTIVIMFKAL